MKCFRNGVRRAGLAIRAMVLDGQRVDGRLAFSLDWLGDKGRAICIRGRMKCFHNGALRVGLAIRAMVLV